MGGKLIYDPDVQVDHFESKRFDADQRVSVFFQADAQCNAVHNETLIMMQYLPAVRRFAFLIWAATVGTRAEPGITQFLRLLLAGERNAIVRLKATILGRVAGINSFRQWRSSQ